MKQITLTFIIGVLLLSCQQKESPQKHQNKPDDRILVKVQLIKQQQDQVTLTYNGLTEPTLTVPMSFQVPGKIAKINFDEGDVVRKGQVIASLDKVSFESAYQAALATKAQAQDAYDRLKIVHDKGSLPEIKWHEIQAKLQQASSSVEVAKKNLINCEITSPINGMIGSRSIEVGETATPGITALKVISTKDLYVRVSVADNEINRIQKSQEAEISFSALGGSTIKGKVEKIGIMANTISKTFEVKIKISNANTEIKPGMTCDINIPLETTSPKLLVPIQSVMQDANNQHYVFVVNKQDQTAHRQIVQTSGIINNQLCINSGLKPGGYLVIEGQHKLNDQAKVKFK